MQRERVVAIAELTLAGALWGFGFIAASWALEGMGPLAITGWRFLLAVVVGAAIVAATPALRRDVRWEYFKTSAIPGLFLSLTLVTQTWGLLYTTATKSGFITVLYVLLVPMLERVVMKRSVPRYHMIYVVGSLVGVALICDLPGALFGSELQGSSREQMNVGDLLTLACAVFAALQIFWFGLIHERIGSSFVFNLYQSFWAGLIPLVLSFFIEAAPEFSTYKPIVGLLALALGSTLIAFALQIRAQKTISPSLASLLFLLESPFAAFFAVIFLGERLTTLIAVGALIILLSLASSVVFNRETEENG